VFAISFLSRGDRTGGISACVDCKVRTREISGKERALVMHDIGTDRA
jgi:hypothetical protein